MVQLRFVPTTHDGRNSSLFAALPFFIGLKSISKKQAAIAACPSNEISPSFLLIYIIVGFFPIAEYKSPPSEFKLIISFNFFISIIFFITKTDYSHSVRCQQYLRKNYVIKIRVC